MTSSPDASGGCAEGLVPLEAALSRGLKTQNRALGSFIVKLQEGTLRNNVGNLGFYIRVGVWCRGLGFRLYGADSVRWLRRFRCMQSFCNVLPDLIEACKPLCKPP